MTDWWRKGAGGIPRSVGLSAPPRLRGLLPFPELTSLSLRDYRLWWISSSAAMLNQFVSQMALTWWVKIELERPTLVGSVVLAFGVPAFLFLFPAGLLADRWDRKRQLQAAQAVGLSVSLALALLIASDRATFPIVVVLAFLSGSTVAVSNPARQALIRQLVPRPLLANAVVLGSLSMNLSQLVAPSVAGLLIAAVGVHAAFFFIATLLGVSLISLGAMRIPRIDVPEDGLRKGPHGTGRRAGDPLRGVGANSGAWEGMLATVGGGFRFLWATKPLLVMMLLYFVGGAFVAGPILTLLPVLIDDVWERDAASLGLAFSVQAAASLLTGLYLTRIGGLRNKGGFFSLSMMLGPGSMALYSVSPTYSLALAFFFTYGIAVSVFTNMSQTILQGNTPPQLLGRVLSVYQLSIMGVIPFGAFVSGVSAEWIGAPLTGFIGGAVGFTASLTALLFAPRYRRLD